MNKKKTIILIGELIGECLIGLAMGTIANNATKDSTTGEKIVVAIGGALATYAIGNHFGRTVFKLSDEHLDTDFNID